MKLAPPDGISNRAKDARAQRRTRRLMPWFTALLLLACAGMALQPKPANPSKAGVRAAAPSDHLSPAVLAGFRAAESSAPGGDQSRPDNPALRDFDEWVRAYESAPTILAKGKLLKEGEALAAKRALALAAIMKSDPRGVLESALPAERLASLPEAVRKHLEERVSGIGDYQLIGGIPLPGGKAVPYERQAVIGGKTYRAHVYGERLGQVTQENIPLEGVAVGGEIALLDGLPAAVARSARTEGAKTLLFIRADFSDLAGDPLAASTAQSLIDTTVNNFYKDNSYNKTSLSATVVPGTVRLPQLASYYASNFSALISDGRAAAKAAGYDTANYSLDIVATRYLGNGAAGQGYVGGKGTALYGYFDLRVTAHELGHNYGAWHANYWATTDGSVIGPGSNQEYGDAFDIMSSGSTNPLYHFNAYFKNAFNWLTSTQVANVTASGTYRIFAFDDVALPAGNRGALKVAKDSDRVYWVDFRQKFTGNPWLMNGADLHWDPWASSNGGTQLLDTTPGTGNGKNDSAIVIGRTFSDTAAGIHITPIGKGGTTPQSLDVVVNLGSFPGNAAPSVTVTPNPASAAPNAVVNFTANASDANGDALAFFWDFGDGSWGTNAPTASKSWSAWGTYTVRCTVTDMKGGAASATSTVYVSVATPPVAQSQTVFTTPNTAKAFTLQATDANNDPLAYIVLTNPAHGTLSGAAPNLAFTPAAGYVGNDSFTFKANDGTADSNIATVSIIVGDQDPTLTLYWKLDETGGTTASDSSGYGHTGTLTNGPLWTSGKSGGAVSFADANDMILTAQLVSIGTNWTIGAWFTAPLPNTGTWHTLTRAQAGGGDHQIITDGSLNLGMYDNATGGAFRGCGFNLGGLAAGWHHIASVGSGTTATFFVDGVNVGVSDRKSSSDVYAVGNYQGGGQRFTDKLDEVRVYTRALSAAEIATLANATPAAPSITTQPANRTVIVGQTAAFSVVATGPAPLAYQWRKNAVAITGATGASYTTPATVAADNGAAFSVTVSNGSGSVTSNNAILTVNPNAAPVANNQGVTTAEDTAKAITLTASDPDNWPQALSFTVLTSPANGALTGTAPNLTYTPAGNFNGTDSFTFRASDGAANSNTATVTITVTSVNDAPQIESPPWANPNPVTLPATTSVNVVAADPDNGPNPLTYSWSMLSGPGTVGFSPNGTASANISTASFSVAGTYTLRVTVSDGAASVTGDVTVTVQAGSQPPSITTQPANQTVLAGQTATFSVVATGTAPLSYQWRKNGANIAGATASSYTTPATTTADNGTLFSVVVANSGGSATSNNATLTVNAGSGLLGWWKLDETSGTAAADSSGTGNNGTLAGGAAWGTGKVGGGLNFDGVNDAVAVSPTPYSGVVNSFTLAVWVNPLATRVAIGESTGGAGGISSQRYAIFPTQGEAAGYGSGHAGAGLSVGTNGVSVFEHSGGYMPSPLEYNATLAGWTHVAAVYENRTPKLYINGTLVKTGLTSSYTIHPSGSMGGTSYGWYQGGLDDVRLYNRALSASEVAALATVSPTAPAITQQPVNVTVNAGQTATFSVVATGTAPLSYQWRKNGAAVSGATGASHTTPATVAADNGALFSVVVTNAAGSATSNNATLTVTSGGDVIWVGDSIPTGGVAAADGGDGWNWVGANPAPFSGSLASQSNLASGEHQHYFYGATQTLAVNAGDTLIAYVYLDPANVPSEIMLQWNDGSWEHRAYWGANSIGWGTDGTNSRRYLGTLPVAGQWVRLQVAASQVGLEGATLNGMAFTLYGGRATWDHAGKGAATTQPPVITTQPASQTVTAGQTATFNVVATGTAPLTYQWQKNGVAISGATGASYTTPATTTADSGSAFRVVVSNSAGSVTSSSAILTVNAATVPPAITTQPASLTVAAGQTATFSVVATGTAPLSYQWQKNSMAISGATGASYTTPATTAADSGSTFRVIVSNSAGSVTSNAATLTVTATSNRVAHWSLDETAGTLAADDSGFGNHGTLANGPLWTAGKVGGALSFDGVNDYVSHASLSGLAPGNTPHTVAAWVKVAALPSSRAWILQLGNDGTGSHHWLLNSSGGTQFGKWNGEQFKPVLPVGQWKHLAVTFDGSTLRGYVDGAALGAQASSFNLQGIPLTVAQQHIGENYFNGLVDDVRVYNRALTAAEVGSLATAGAAPALAAEPDTTGDEILPAGLTTSDSYAVSKLQVTLDFAKQAKDSVAFSGHLTLPEGFAPAGQALTIRVGGVEWSFVLDARGRGIGAAGKILLKTAARARNGGARASSLRVLLKGDFAAAFAEAGLGDKSVKGQATALWVTARLAERTYVGGRDPETVEPLTLTYTARQGISGVAKLPKSALLE